MLPLTEFRNVLQFGTHRETSSLIRASTPHTERICQNNDSSCFRLLN